MGVIHGSPNLDEMLGSHDGGIAFSTLGTMFRDGSEMGSFDCSRITDGSSVVLIYDGSAKVLRLFLFKHGFGSGLGDELAKICDIPAGCRFAIGYRGHRNENKVSIAAVSPENGGSVAMVRPPAEFS